MADASYIRGAHRLVLHAVVRLLQGLGLATLLRLVLHGDQIRLSFELCYIDYRLRTREVMSVGALSRRGRREATHPVPIGELLVLGARRARLGRLGLLLARLVKVFVMVELLKF